MIRTQIQLTEAQANALKQVANQKKVSMAKIIRQCIDLFINSYSFVDIEERKKRAIAAIGRFKSGKHDISENHDDYFTEDLLK